MISNIQQMQTSPTIANLGHGFFRRMHVDPITSKSNFKMAMLATMNSSDQGPASW